MLCFPSLSNAALFEFFEGPFVSNGMSPHVPCTDHEVAAVQTDIPPEIPNPARRILRFARDDHAPLWPEADPPGSRRGRSKLSLLTQERAFGARARPAPPAGHAAWRPVPTGRHRPQAAVLIIRQRRSRETDCLSFLAQGATPAHELAASGMVEAPLPEFTPVTAGGGRHAAPRL